MACMDENGSSVVCEVSVRTVDPGSDSHPVQPSIGEQVFTFGGETVKNSLQPLMTMYEVQGENVREAKLYLFTALNDEAIYTTVDDLEFTVEVEKCF